MSERSIGGKPPLNLRPLGTMLIIIRVISAGTLKVLPGTLVLLPMDRLLVQMIFGLTSSEHLSRLLTVTRL